MRVLIVEDDSALAQSYAQALSHYGYQMSVAENGETAETMLATESFDLLLLDVGLPKLDGLQVLERLRAAQSKILVMLLTARDTEIDRIRGLDLGADDYMVKPVAIGELAARIRALLRRSHFASSHLLTHGPLKLDLHAHRATVGDRLVNLTKREWAMLECLMRNPGRVVSRDQMLQVACGREEQFTYNAIEVYVSRLRAKLEPMAIHIRTVRGFGYMLEEMTSQ